MFNLVSIWRFYKRLPLNYLFILDSKLNIERHNVPLKGSFSFLDNEA